jgi:glyoxylase-like metal-dependent hydrolase (beta-lactamase superfamily II)
MQIKFRAAMLAASLLSCLSLAHAQDDVQIETIQVRGNIYMLTGQGGNIGLFTGADGSFMVDDQFAPLTEKIVAAVRSAGGDTPKYLINTHFHGDHTGGNENLGKAGTLIMSHHAVRERLLNGSFIAAFDMKSAPAKGAMLPALTYADNMHLHINGDTVRIVHVARAHTDGDSFVVFTNANVVHAGDLFFNGFFPFIDGANGGSVKGVIDGIDAMLALTDDDSRIIPGHGPLAARGDLQAYRDMLASAYARLLALKNQGLSAEEAIARQPLKDLEGDWGGGIFDADKWIGVVYPAVF